MQPTMVVVGATAILVTLVLSGCFGGLPTIPLPGTDFTETGKTVRLKASVLDLAGQEIYPGFKANLWAFCFEPQDPSDEYSAKAIEPRPTLPNDAPVPPALKGRCGVPGPTLRVQQGDRVIVEFTNSHFHPHTIHWHGMPVPWQSDGAPGTNQDSVVTGSTYTYDFIAKKSGTMWYHCHVDTQLHVMQGLYGMLIVEPQDKEFEPEDIDREYNLVFSTLRRATVEAIPGFGPHNHPAGCASGFQGCENPTAEVEPDVFMINGHSYPYTEDDPTAVIHLKEGERVRIRMLNAGTTIEEIHPHGHDLLVTHQDGNPIPPAARWYVDVLRIGPAERFDVVLEANNPGVWMLHTHVNDHETNCGKTPGGMHTMMAYDGYHDKMHSFKAELPATCPYNSGLALPQDFANQTTIRVGTVSPAQPFAGASWTFPVSLVCATRSLDVRVHLEAPGPFLMLEDVRVALTAPDGQVVGQWTLGSNLTAGEYWLSNTGLQALQTGTYTATVASQQAVEAVVRLSAAVDYYEDFEMTKEAHLRNGVAGCPGYT